MVVNDKNAAYVIFDTEHGVINTQENKDIRVLDIDGISNTPSSVQTSSNPYVPGEIVLNTKHEARTITVDMTAPRIYRPQIIKQFAPGRKGRLTVNWGGCMRYIDYIVNDSEIVQETIAKDLKVFLTLRCPGSYFNDMSDFGENIAATIPLIIFPNLWELDCGLVPDQKRFESAVALENSGDVPIGIKLVITAVKGSVLNPVVFLSESVYFRVLVSMAPNDVLEISTVRREKYVKLNGENILNKTDMSSTFFEIEPGEHKIYYNAEDGMENMDIYLHRRPQYLGV